MGCGSSHNSKYNYKDFPTPDMLAEAQMEYQRYYYSKDKNDNTNKEKNKKVNFDGAPDPYPPRCRKSQIFNIQDYFHLDRRAKLTPFEMASDSYEKLVSYLVKTAKNDVGKARAIFVWIASQRLQQIMDYVGDRLPPSKSPLYSILHILVKQWGNGYSEIFSKMCKCAGIPCKIVKGKVKGSSYKLGEKVEGTNDYCLIFVDNDWRIVDPHWGSQYVINRVDDDDWDSVLHDDKRNKQSLNADEIEVGQICDDFYFLTDPEAIVYTHLACETANQLLARPVTEDEFWQMALLKDAFFDLEMTTVNYPKCIIHSDNGNVHLKFGLSSKIYSLFCYGLYKSSYDPKANIINGVNIDQYVLMEITKNQLDIKIYFPIIGKYKFELYGKNIEENKGFEVVCEYAIICSEPDLKFEPLPQNTRSEWGENGDTQSIGMVPINLKGGILKTDNGKINYGFKLTKSQMLLFSSKLINVQNKKENLKNCVRHYRKDDEVHFYIKCPQQGRYIHEISCKKPGERQYVNECNYLIESSQGCSDLSFYPDIENCHGQTGDMSQLTKSPVLQPVSHKESIIDPIEVDKEMILTMKSYETLSQMSAHLEKHYFLDSESEDCSNYAYLHQSGRDVKCYLNFLKVGFYKLNLLHNKEIAYQYLINVIEPNFKAVPYPERTSAWQSNYFIDEPKSYNLKAGEKINFMFTLPDAKEAIIEGKTYRQPLNKVNNGGDIWEKEIIVPTNEQTLNLKVVTSNKGPVNVLTYKVVKNSELDEMKQSVATEKKKTEEFLKEMEEQKENEERLMKKANKDKEEKYIKARDNYNKNKKYYEEEEEKLQQKEKELETVGQKSMDKTEKMTKRNANGHSGNKEHPSSTYYGGSGNNSKGKIIFSPEPSSRGTDSELDGREKHFRTYQIEGTEDWKLYHPKLSSNLALERLRECIRHRDKTLLKASIDSCHENGLKDHKEVRTATMKLYTFDARQRLESACLTKNPSAIRKELDGIYSQGLQRYLQNECREAGYLLESLERNNTNKNILNMDKKTMTEIRRYMNPPPTFHKIMQSTFLLLGEDEETTDSWRECQRLCNPQGSNGLNRKIILFDVAKVHPEIVSRSNQILEDVDISKVQTVSPGAGTFYVWTKGVIDEYETMYNLSEYKPASRERQKEIFGKINEEPIKNRNYYKSLVSGNTSREATSKSSRKTNSELEGTWRY
ncbi:hypothetical protein HELRODRAFT_173674 [Helobdella robusta]|uniref:KY-like immunoglobulin-like domain-containing protein n=1 Tax=Helobdella robusta TaxID=6412 RepID=T1F739_HELRO|nr:hypothetical protein HELRODRAFT_173674 [Helobdella robusta]ESO03382.1 hypothetical protein HELRODRAFT_173674 [Helobdella robusta]